MKKFQFNTGVRPFDHHPPAGMAFMDGFEDSGNGVYVIPFYCENVPDNASFKYTDDYFIEDTSESICREIYNSRLISKYAHFII
jgi:hypothetical protein